MKKTIGHYTTAATKTLKGSRRIICHTTDDGEIYVSNGYVLYKLTPAEYAALVQPSPAARPGTGPSTKTASMTVTTICTNSFPVSSKPLPTPLP